LASLSGSIGSIFSIMLVIPRFYSLYVVAIGG
jgi:hypothetical protein